MRILITGAALSKSLLAPQGHQVIGINSLNDYYEVSLKEVRLAQLIPNNRFNFRKMDLSVVNLAAQSAVLYSLENPQQVWCT